MIQSYVDLQHGYHIAIYHSTSPETQQNQAKEVDVHVWHEFIPFTLKFNPLQLKERKKKRQRKRYPISTYTPAAPENRKKKDVTV